MSITPFTPMTKQHVAEVLGVSIRTIENLVKAGRMPAPGHIGGRVLWHPDTFYAWLDQALRASCSITEGPDVSEPSQEEPEMGRASEAVEPIGAPALAMSQIAQQCANPGRPSGATAHARTRRAPKLSAGERMQARQARKLQWDDADGVR
ncbi:MAG: helix-turn-helix domain-containing protein [Ralstonia sp.]|jgi:excisionase family DNA binding protein|uniref:Helix-turn-helix domain-containing protein n=2 Tax=Ralstonia pickettii TaxID=329 RepID=A0A2P4REP0_RALPI|nr:MULTISPECIES: helix-turn-helix domain-containing protein [Ralstonia]MBA4232253.1 DNA-binding protein [Ralstonia sp.]MBA4236681.1 DNA-binding protein [Ralstonia sp.]MBA4403298.1 DNA-binding protein [Ralstonia sp.]MBA9847559.1 DNA-binding protein [Ralstonia pickettii]MBA9852977.1 DNA-binding protein [Ralstonia pickettii]